MTDDLKITRENAFKEILQKTREAKAGEELFLLVGQDQNFTNYDEFEGSFPQSTEQCRCELPWRDYLKHFWCPCLDTMEKVERYKNIVLNVVERAKIVFDNYKNETIAQIERELREKLPPNAEEINNFDWWKNWREEIRSRSKREEIERFKNSLLSLAEKLREIKNEYEERRNQRQQEREEQQRIQREMQRRMEERIRASREEARELAESLLQTQQEARRKLEESIQKLAREAEERQKARQEQVRKEKEAGKSKSSSLPPSDDKKIDKEIKPMEFEKLPKKKFKKADSKEDIEENQKKLRFLLDKIKEKEENNKKKNLQYKKENGVPTINIINLGNIKKINLTPEGKLLVEFDENNKSRIQIINNEEITKNPELQKIKNYLQKENKKSLNQQEINNITASSNTRSDVENQPEKKTSVLFNYWTCTCS